MARRTALRCQLKRYFTGRPCAAGHVCERYTSNASCVECSAIASFEATIPPAPPPAPPMALPPARKVYPPSMFGKPDVNRLMGRR